MGWDGMMINESEMNVNTIADTVKIFPLSLKNNHPTDGIVCISERTG